VLGERGGEAVQRLRGARFGRAERAVDPKMGKRGENF